MKFQNTGWLIAVFSFLFATHAFAQFTITYDQLINEYDYSWIHVSYRSGKNRMQILSIK